MTVWGQVHQFTARQLIKGLKHCWGGKTAPLASLGRRLPQAQAEAGRSREVHTHTHPYGGSGDKSPRPCKRLKLLRDLSGHHLSVLKIVAVGLITKSKSRGEGGCL